MILSGAGLAAEWLGRYSRGSEFGQDCAHHFMRHRCGDFLHVKSPGNIPSLFLRVEYGSLPFFSSDSGVSDCGDGGRVLIGLGKKMEAQGRSARSGKTTEGPERGN